MVTRKRILIGEPDYFSEFQDYTPDDLRAIAKQMEASGQEMICLNADNCYDDAVLTVTAYRMETEEEAEMREERQRRHDEENKRNADRLKQQKLDELAKEMGYKLVKE